jgi:hypothetical protein
MMARSLLALALLAASTAGCVRPPPEGAPEERPAFDAATPFVVNFTSPKCTETDLVFFIDTAAAQRLLPNGFKAGDATALVAASPVASGKAAVLVATTMCADTTLGGEVDEGQVAILVQAPKVNGTRPAAALDFYETYRYVNSSNESAVLDALNWDHSNATIKASQAGTGGTGSIVENGTTMLSFTVTTPASQSFSGIGRFWHATGVGLAYMDYKIASTQQVGAADCTIHTESAVAKATGAKSCTPGSAAGLLLAPYKLEASIVNLPGASVGG